MVSFVGTAPLAAFIRWTEPRPGSRHAKAAQYITATRRGLLGRQHRLAHGWKVVPDHDVVHRPCEDHRVVRISLVPYTSDWPRAFETERDRIVSVLGERALEVHHAGSTSVPGLRAKPIIDVALVVPDTVDEAAYLPRLEAVGYSLLLREPDWFEHRLLRREEPAVNLHVFPPRCVEVDRMLAFRDHLRKHRDDRELYESTKLALSEREWTTIQDYADAKDDVVADIMSRVDS